MRKYILLAALITFIANIGNAFEVDPNDVEKINIQPPQAIMVHFKDVNTLPQSIRGQIFMSGKGSEITNNMSANNEVYDFFYYQIDNLLDNDIINLEKICETLDQYKNSGFEQAITNFLPEIAHTIIKKYKVLRWEALCNLLDKFGEYLNNNDRIEIGNLLYEQAQIEEKKHFVPWTRVSRYYEHAGYAEKAITILESELEKLTKKIKKTDMRLYWYNNNQIEYIKNKLKTLKT